MTQAYSISQRRICGYARLANRCSFISSMAVFSYAADRLLGWREIAGVDRRSKWTLGMCVLNYSLFAPLTLDKKRTRRNECQPDRMMKGMASENSHNSRAAVSFFFFFFF